MTLQRIGFVATKPLQIMTSLAIASQFRGLPMWLYVMPNFADGRRIVQRLGGRADDFDEVLPAATRVAGIMALAARGATRIFVDSDVGLQTGFAMRSLHALRPRLRFSLYEEGVGLFGEWHDESPNVLYDLVGATGALGGSRFVDEVWTYSPDALRSRLAVKPLKEIDCNLAEFVCRRRSMLKTVFWPTFAEDAGRWNGTTCSVYMSSWKVDANALAYVANADAFSICKFHPHIRRDATIPSGIDQIMHPSVPAELAITELAAVFEHVEIVHHGTSTARYVDLPNVEFVLWND